MIQINLFDDSFSHVSCSVLNRTLTKFEYVRNKMQWGGVTIFTNEYIFSNLVDEVESPIKIGWLLEPRSIKPQLYESAQQVEHKFDCILTHDDTLLNRTPETPNSSNKYKFTPVGGCWIREENYNIFPKKKIVSTIASPKRQTSGHQLRHIIIDKWGEKMDVFGRDYNLIDSKEEGLCDYRFSVVVENSSVKNYFTEKLLDCFAVGTIPIYWGCNNIEDYFDMRGILRFTTPGELNSIMSSLNDELYEKLLEPVKKNFELFRSYELTEDWIYENILKNMM